MEILDRTALEAIGIQWGGAGAGNVGQRHAWWDRASSRRPADPAATGVSPDGQPRSTRT